MMTGHSGIFAGGDMVPSERTVTIGVGHGKKAARNIDAFLRNEPYVAPAKKAIADFDKLHLWFYTEAMQRPQGHLDIKRRKSTFEEVLHRSEREGGGLRGQALPVLRQLLRVRRLLRCVPGRCDHQARPRQPIPVRLRSVHRLRRLLRAVPLPRDHDDPGTGRRRIGLPSEGPGSSMIATPLNTNVRRDSRG